MVRSRLILIALLMAVARSSLAHAAPNGVQWTPDGSHILVNKDVGAERWSIALNLGDLSATGNVFFTDGRTPAFIWCEKTADEFDSTIGEITLQYRCFGSQGSVGGFGIDDWTLISEEVFLPLSFFVPSAETCDLHDAINGPRAQNATSYWDCNGNGGAFEFRVFGDGTAATTKTGIFTFDVVGQACKFAKVAEGSFLDAEYAPSRDRLTLYELTPAVDHLTLSECYRHNL